MSRRVQHIAPKDEVKKAERKGQKVTSLCGAHHYPMTKMGDDIPTCTPCSRVAMAEYHEVLAELDAARSVRVPVAITVQGPALRWARWSR